MLASGSVAAGRNANNDQVYYGGALVRVPTDAVLDETFYYYMKAKFDSAGTLEWRYIGIQIKVTAETLPPYDEGLCEDAEEAVIEAVEEAGEEQAAVDESAKEEAEKEEAE